MSSSASGTHGGTSDAIVNRSAGSSARIAAGSFAVPTSAPTSWTAEVIADVVVSIPWQSTAAPPVAEAEAGAGADADAATAPELDAVPDADGTAGTDEGDEVVPDPQAPVNRATKPSVANTVVTLTVAANLPVAELSGMTR
jgi:hypothetical protein